jgi:serine/threonine protein kinase
LRVATDQTLPQTSEQLRRAQQLSLQRTRPPAEVPGYETDRFLGAGAYGEVWVAIDRNTRRRVAIKFYTHRGGLDWSLLSREVEKLAFLFADRYVVQLVDVGWDSDPPYYIMEYLDNGSLADRLSKGPMPAAEAVALFREVTIGLIHAHGKGVLHCDLKPANVLLDQDMKPRLADFGQSRLSHEQTPALGTLFYMAPEQADLKAVPDARWDVYALGALLYCMLTGEPPYRTSQAATLMSQATGLDDQLQRYVRLLHELPRPQRHRQTPGVDRDLAETIDRCLNLNPSKRFANPQAVLAALQNRAMRQSRRPLLVLGALGPAVLLLVMSVYAWNAAETAVKESEKSLVQDALESNRFAARFVAETVAAQIDSRWYTLEQEASDAELRSLVGGSSGKPRESGDRIRVQQRLDSLRKQYPDINASSWFLTDANGTQLARSPLDEKLVDHNYAYRDYFNGLGHDLTPEEAKHVPPITLPHRSQVYVSDGSKNRTLAFSVPVWSGSEDTPDRHVIGVLGIAVEMGHFAVLRSENGAKKERIAVLVDTRADGGKDPRKGLILEHPHLCDAVDKAENRCPEVYIDAAEVARLEELRKATDHSGSAQSNDKVAALATQEFYDDPVDGSFAGRWLAAFEPVIVPDRELAIRDTGWIVIVQERFDDAVRPARELGAQLRDGGLIALGLVIAVVTALWGFVIVVLNESPRFRLMRILRRSAGLPSPASSANIGSSTQTACTESPSMDVQSPSSVDMLHDSDEHHH